MRDPGPSGSGDVPTVLVRGSEGQDLLCFLEQLIPLDGKDYALLTPVDTPVSLFRLKDEGDPEPITTIASSEPILSVADVVLQEHDLTLVRSAVTLTVAESLRNRIPMNSRMRRRTSTMSPEQTFGEFHGGRRNTLVHPPRSSLWWPRWLMDRPNWWKGKTSIAFNPGSKRNSTNVIQGNDQQASSGA